MQTIEPVDVFWKCNKGYLAVTHPLPNGDILIANTGDPAGNGKGEFCLPECPFPCPNARFPAQTPISLPKLPSREPHWEGGSLAWSPPRPSRVPGGFLLLDGDSYDLKGNWENECETPPTGHDFWYKAQHNVLVSSAGLVPRVAGRGFNPEDLKRGGDTRLAAMAGLSAGLAGLGAPERPICAPEPLPGSG